MLKQLPMHLRLRAKKLEEKLLLIKMGLIKLTQRHYSILTLTT